MYQIINYTKSKVLGFVSEPIYIKLNNLSGSYIPVKDIKEATGIVFNSIPYNLQGTSGIGVEEEAYAIPIDTANLMFLIPSLKESIDEIEDALCELDKEENK